MTDFDSYMERRLNASTAFVEGNVQPLLDVSVADDPATIFPPNGTVVSGHHAVNSGNARGAAAFAPGAQNDFDVEHSGASDTLAYWCGLQRSRVHMAGQDSPVEMTLRVTELFRQVDGEWKLFHRHADMASVDA